MIINLVHYVLIFINLIVCIVLMLIVLLQRGEEGMFAKMSRYGQIKTDGNDLRSLTVKLTIPFVALPVIVNMIL